MTGTSEGNPCPKPGSTGIESRNGRCERPTPEAGGSVRDTVDPHTETARRVFATLAPLLAARRSMRLWDPDATPARYADRGRCLTRKLPDQPAAVPIYQHRRTRLLVLDFDAKNGHTSAAVDRDVANCLRLLRACGAAAITDRSTSGGRHILVPLADGAPLTRAEIEPVLRALAARLPTLDITAMLNDRTGAITPPGSRCRDGGFRVLDDGTLDDAVRALTTRSRPAFWAELSHALGLHTGTGWRAAREVGAPRAVARTPRTLSPTSADTHFFDARIWEGSEDHARLRARFRRVSPIPSAVLDFAREGRAPSARWRAHNGRLDRSAARQSVLTAVAHRGYSYTDLLAQLPDHGGTWTGLATAYDRYGTRRQTAMRRDWNSACRWISRNAREFLPSAHKYKEHTGGWAPTNHARQRRWLAAATTWADAHWPNSPKRWTAHAVLQALAYASTRKPDIHRGTPIIEFGGRSLSLVAGSMPETTLWQALREIRDLPGAPIQRIRAATGPFADRYALTLPRLADRPITIDHTRIARTRIEPVHPAWRIVGLSRRRLYENIVDTSTTTAGEAIATTALGRTAGYNALAALTTIGLLRHTRTTVCTGSRTLDDIARAHGLPALRQDTIARHRRERAAWMSWLTVRTPPDLRAPVPTSRRQRRANSPRRPTDAPHPGFSGPPGQRRTSPVFGKTPSRAGSRASIVVVQTNPTNRARREPAVNSETQASERQPHTQANLSTVSAADDGAAVVGTPETANEHRRRIHSLDVRGG